MGNGERERERESWREVVTYLCSLRFVSLQKEKEGHRASLPTFWIRWSMRKRMGNKKIYISFFFFFFSRT